MDEKYKVTMFLVSIAAIAVLAYFLLTAPDRRSTGDKIDDAINRLGDRTPAEKMGDAIKDVGGNQ